MMRRNAAILEAVTIKRRFFAPFRIISGKKVTKWQK